MMKGACLCFSLLMFAVMAMGENLAPKAAKFPKVSQLNGKVQNISPKGGVTFLKKDEVLVQKAHLISEAKAQLRVELSATESLTLLENSEVILPVIEWESGQVSEVQLVKGKIRIDTHGPNQIIYSTPLSRDVYSDVDFLLSYDAVAARVRVDVFAGNLNFRGFEGEVQAHAGPGQSVSFQGMLEQGEPSFDILLKGHKVARGQLSAVRDLTKEELAVLDRESLVKKPVAPVTKLPKRQPGQICEHPFAKLNECVWTCEGVPKKKKPLSCVGFRCLRRRCTANGEWSDPFELPGAEAECQVQPIVKACDY